MTDNKTVVSTHGGIGIGGLLGVAFVVLRLMGVIDWPWVWVLSPFWIPVALVTVLVLLVFACEVGKK